MEILNTIAIDLWATLTQMAPYLLFGFAVAGVLSVLVPPEKVENHLGGKGFLPVLKAALFGVPLPLCSCGVIPVAASLRKHGASRGATMAFLLSTPQTGVDSIAVTYGMLGPIIAVFRPVVALLTGLIGGFLSNKFDTEGGTRPERTEACTDDCCSPTGKKRSMLVQAIRYAFITMPRDIAKPMIAGIVVAGVIAALVPKDYFASLLGHGISAMFVMMLVGIPLYVCATASVPVAAALIAKGISPGAAMVFLITGPATNAATIAIVWRILGKRATVIYLGTVAVTALAAGFLLDWILVRNAFQAESLACHTTTSPLEAVSGVILLGVLGAALFKRPVQHGRSQPDEKKEERLALQIEGMTCNHCADNVSRALLECPGVTSVEVDLAGHRAVVSGVGLSGETLAKTVERLGYKAACKA